MRHLPVCPPLTDGSIYGLQFTYNKLNEKVLQPRAIYDAQMSARAGSPARRETGGFSSVLISRALRKREPVLHERRLNTDLVQQRADIPVMPTLMQ